MNPLIIIAVLLALISVVGLAKKNRELFLTGYFVYGFWFLAQKPMSLFQTKTPQAYLLVFCG